MLLNINQPYRILIVDDDIDACTAIRARLNIQPYAIDQCHTGSEALAGLRELAVSDRPYNLVILDFRLPDLAGLEVLRQIRSDPLTRSTKVLMLTAADEIELKVQALNSGADDYLNKLCQAEEMRARVVNLLRSDLAERSLVNANQKAAALEEISKRMNEEIACEGDLTTHLEFILDKLAQFVEFDSASIMLVQNGGLKIAAQRGFRSSQQNFFDERLESLQHVRQVIQEGKPVIIPDTSRDPRWYLLPDEEYIECWLGVPLIYKNDPIGILNLDKQEADYYTEAHSREVQAFADHAAIAIHNADVICQVQQSELLSRALVDISRLLAEKREMQEQLQAVWEFVSRQLHATMFFVALYHRNPDRLVFEHAYDLNKPLSHLPPVYMDDPVTWGLAGHVFFAQQAVAWSTAQERKKVLDRLGIRSRVEGTPAAACITLPLDASGQRIGVISMQSDQPRPWSETELDIFKTLASQVAVNIQNTQLMDKLQESAHSLKNAFEASERITAELRPEKVLRQIVENPCARMGVWWTCLVLMDAGGTAQQIETHQFYRPIQNNRWVRADGYSVQVFREKQAIFVGDVAADRGAHPDMLPDGVRAAACLPLISNQRTLGVLWIHYRDGRDFSEGEKAAWNLYANQAAIAYENAIKMRDLENIRHASEALSAAETSAGIRQTIVQSARRIFASDSAIMLPYCEDGIHLCLEQGAVEGIPAETWTAFTQEMKESGGRVPGIDQEVVWVETGLQHQRAGDADGEINDLLERFQVRSAMVIGLRLRDEPLGVVFVNYQHPYRPAESDTQKGLTLAYQASLALKRAFLRERLKLVNETSQAAAKWTVSGNLTSTLDSIVQGTKETLHCDIVTLYTLNQERERFNFPPAMAGVTQPDKVKELQYVERGAMPYRILEMDLPLVVQDTEAPGALVSPFTKRENVRSYVGVPLAVSSGKVGVMFINFYEHHNFSQDDLANIELFSNMAAIAISLAQQVEHIQQNQQQAAQRLSLDYMEAMSSSYFHAIKSMATTIRDLARRVEDYLEKGLPVERAQEKLAKIRDMVADIHAIPYYPTPSEDNYEIIPINNLINERVNQFSRKGGRYGNKEYKLALQVGDEVRVRGYTELLRRALDILINNAVDAVEDTPEKWISISTALDPSRDNVEIIVADSGVGVPPAVEEIAFRKPVPKKPGERGSGMGLYLTGIIFNMHRGSIEIHETGPNGSKIRVRLPIDQ